MSEENFTQAHADACKKGLEWYLDPQTGLLVFTQLKLIKNGECCGSGCRHCPYFPRAKAGNRTRA